MPESSKIKRIEPISLDKGKDCIFLLGYCHESGKHYQKGVEDWLIRNCYCWPKLTKNVTRPRVEKFIAAGFLEGSKRIIGKKGKTKVPIAITDSGIDYLIETIETFCQGRVWDLQGHVISEIPIVRDMIVFSDPLNSPDCKSDFQLNLIRARKEHILWNLADRRRAHDWHKLRGELGPLFGCLTAELSWLDFYESALLNRIVFPKKCNP